MTVHPPAAYDPATLEFYDRNAATYVVARQCDNAPELLHVPTAALPAILARIHAALKPGG